MMAGKLTEDSITLQGAGSMAGVNDRSGHFCPAWTDCGTLPASLSALVRSWGFFVTAFSAYILRFERLFRSVAVSE